MSPLRTISRSPSPIRIAPRKSLTRQIFYAGSMHPLAPVVRLAAAPRGPGAPRDGVGSPRMRTRDRNLSDTSSLLKEGQTCWKLSNATRAALLVDGEQYFGVLREALLQAREQVLIAGWDFDSRIL